MSVSVLKKIAMQSPTIYWMYNLLPDHSEQKFVRSRSMESSVPMLINHTRS